MTELARLLAPLNAVLFTLGNDQVSVAELLGPRPPGTGTMHEAGGSTVVDR